MKGENYYFVLQAKEPLEAPFIPFRTSIRAAFLHDENATEPKLLCVRVPDLRIQYQKELSNSFALRRFIENQNRDWLIKITGHTIQDLYRSRNELSFVVTREARDRELLHELETFITMMELGILKADPETDRLYKLAKNSYQLAYLDTQENMQFAARFGIKKNFQKPVFVIEREDDYSKQEYNAGEETKKFQFEENAT